MPSFLSFLLSFSFLLPIISPLLTSFHCLYLPSISAEIGRFVLLCRCGEERRSGACAWSRIPNQHLWQVTILWNQFNLSLLQLMPPIPSPFWVLIFKGFALSGLGNYSIISKADESIMGKNTARPMATPSLGEFMNKVSHLFQYRLFRSTTQITNNYLYRRPLLRIHLLIGIGICRTLSSMGWRSSYSLCGAFCRSSGRSSTPTNARWQGLRNIAFNLCR